MLRTADIEMRLSQSEPGIFQKICNEILCRKGYVPYKYTGSVMGSNKTQKGTPDSVFTNPQGEYVYVEITTQKERIDTKIEKDVEKCLNKIKQYPILSGKISKIIYFHNNDNPDETVNEKIKAMCGNIKFEIYGMSYISFELQNNCKEIAISLLNVRDDFQMMEFPTTEAIKNLADAINKKGFPEYKGDTSEDIKNKIYKLYEEASIITNTGDAMVSISQCNKIKLREIYNKLNAFDFYYSDSSEETKMYYHNMLAILSRVNITEGIEFYRKMPTYAISNISKHYYAILLTINEEYVEAENVLNDLYYNENYKDAFDCLVRVNYLKEDYDTVIKILSGCKPEVFDRHGYMAAMYVISKNIKSKYSEGELLKLNNSKFRQMPIYYFSTAKMLYDINKRNKKYKTQFEKGIGYLNPQDVTDICIMCDNAVAIKQENIAIKYLQSIHLTPVLQSKLLELLCRIDRLTQQEIEYIENIDSDSVNEKINMNFLRAKVCESKGKELEATKLYFTAYQETGNLAAIFKYVQLSIRNKSAIDESVILELTEKKQINPLLVAIDAYNYMGKYEKSIICAYRALYVTRGKNPDIYRQFWYASVMQRDKNIKEISTVLKDCIVIMKHGNKKKIIVIEDNLYFSEHEKIANAEITRSNSSFGISILGMEKGSIVNFDGKDYLIESITDKYTYFARESFKYVMKGKGVEVISSFDGDTEKSVEQIRQRMIDYTADINRRLDIYQDTKNVPLSGLLSDENNFEEYARLINTLLSEDNRVMLSGEAINVDLKSGFVIDISAIIVLAILDLLDIIPVDLLNNIYITTTLKNKFVYFFESLTNEQDHEVGELYIVNGDKLAMNETTNTKKMIFWKKVYSFINNINIIDCEATKDEVLQDNQIGFLDKVQFDLIELSKQMNIPYVCDDLMIRRIAGYYKVKHTNSLQLIKNYSKNQEEYVSKYIKYAKSNYIYTLYVNELTEFSELLYRNFCDENKKIFENILNVLLKNRVNLEYYVPIILDRIEHLRKVQFIKMYEEVYENLLATYFINDIYKIVENKCKEHGSDINKYKPN